MTTGSSQALLRRLATLEQQGAEALFGEPALQLEDILQPAADGRGRIHLLDASRLVHEAPKVYATFLLWLLAELFEQLPERGDADKPLLALFFDEAHLLFGDTPKALQERLQQMRSDVDEFTIDASWRAVAHRLRQASDDAVRPLSRELWQITEQRYPNPSWREIVLDTVRHPIAWPVPTALIVIIGYMRAAMMSFGVLGGLTVTVLIASVIGLLLRSVRSSSGTSGSGAAFWAVFVVAQALGLAVVLGLSVPDPASVSTEVAGSLVAMTISVFAPAAIATLNGARGAVLARLKRHTSRERINQIAQGRHLARLARETATHLHGTVQTSLVACAAAIEQATDSEDPQQLIASMERAIEIVTAPTARPGADEEDVAEAVGRTIAAWQGLVSIESNIDRDVAGIRGLVAATVARVVEECLANAVRHGDATTVQVGVRAHSTGVEVVVEDDGVGMSADDRPGGLGSIVLAESTRGRVTYQPATHSTERPGLRVCAVIGPQSRDADALTRS